MSSTIGFQRMGRKLDMEKDDRFTLHLLDRDSQVGNITSHNVVDAIDHSKRVIIILSRYVNTSLTENSSLQETWQNFKNLSFTIYCNSVNYLETSWITSGG